MRRRALRRLLAPLALAAASLPASLVAQDDCEFLAGTGNVRSMTIGASRITYLGTPNLACRDGVRIRADSAVIFESSAFTQLFGNVRFEDPQRRLRSREAQYFNRVGRLQAQQDVELVRKADHSVIRGSDLVYVPAAEGRSDRLTVTGSRASASLQARTAPAGGGARGDTAGALPRDSVTVTYDVQAELIVLEGESGFVAVGRGRAVEILRDSLRAFGDSVAYDETRGLLALRGDARMVGSGYDLRGRTIDVLLPGQDVREVVAVGDAALTGEDVRLTAPRIRAFLTEGVMERLVAMGAPAPADSGDTPEAPPRPRAVAETFTLVADSIEVEAPGEVLERLVAVGAALGESTARDSLNTPDTPLIARKDWIEGDTIVASFARAPGAADTAAYQLERLEARVGARSLYRLEPSDSAGAGEPGRLAVHYVTGEEIVIDMEAGEVAHMEVVGPARGVHLEPRRPAPRPAPTDSVPPPAPFRREQP